MPRTLFHAPGDRTCSEQSGAALPVRRYTWAPQNRPLPINGSTVLVNPDAGGWAVFDGDESSMLAKGSMPPQGYTGEVLYQLGLCECEGVPASFIRTSEYTEHLYFYEFAVTTGCNLACTYCFADARPMSAAERATPELAELFIDRIAEYRANTRTSIPFVVEFTGGEPLMNFKLIRHTVEYAERAYGELLGVQFCMQSNLTLLTDKILDYLKDHKVNLGVSCDGFGPVHDKQRPYPGGDGSHRTVESNIAKLRASDPHGPGGAITVITDQSVDKMPEIALYLYLQGFQEIVFRPIQEVGRGANHQGHPSFARSYTEQLFNVLNWILTPLYKETGDLLIERSLSLTFQYLFRPERVFMCERSPCGGARNICAVMPDGDVYSCNQAVHEESFRLGNLKDSSFRELLNGEIAHRLRQRTVDSITGCRNCLFRAWCQSPCPIAALWKYGSMMEKSPECDILRLRYDRALRGLVNDEFDLTVVGRLVKFGHPIHWFTF